MRRYLVGIAALALAYFVTAEAGLTIHAIGGFQSLLWAPTAIGLAVTVLYGLRWWPGIALGTILALVDRVPTLWAIAFVTTNELLLVFAGYVLLRGPIRFRPELDRVRDVGAFVAVSIAITFAGATIIAMELVGAGLVSRASFTRVLTMSWWSHLSGLLIVGPAIFTWLRPTPPPSVKRQPGPFEAVILAATSLVVVVLVLGSWIPEWLPTSNAPYSVLPLLLWAGLRFGPRGAAIASFGTSLTAIVAHAFGIGPFDTLYDLQTFVAISTVTTLILSALALERVRAVELKGAIQLAALDGIITIDERGHVREMNPAAERLFLVREEDAIGKDVAALVIPPRLRDAFRSGLRDYLRGKPSTIVGTRYRTTAWRGLDDHEFPVEIAVTRVHFDGHDVFTGFIRDISAEVEARETLMKQAEELAHLGSFDFDLVHGRLKWSDELFRIYGRDPATFEPTYEALLAAIHPDDRATTRAAIEHALATRQPHSFEERIVRPDGSVRVLQTSTRVISEGLRAVRIVGCSQDITERKQVERARTRLARIVEASDDAIIGLSPSGIIETWNPAAKKLLGYASADIVGRSCAELVPGSLRDELRSLFAAVRAGEHVSHYEIAHRRRDGSVFDGSVTMSAVVDRVGRVVGVAMVLRDVSDQKDVETQLRQSLSEKEVLLREIHHRVKNNLQVITSLLNLQVAAEQSPATRQGLIESQNRIQSMALVHKLLYQSKDLGRIDFGEYVKTLAFRLVKTYNVGPECITLDFECAPIWLDIDRAIPCGLILNELVTNALTHAFPDERKGRIEVRCEQSDDRVILTVADDGVGLPPGLALDEVSTFGLQIARTLTLQLEGTIEMIAAPGTTFRITFPKEASARDSKPEIRKFTHGQSRDDLPG